MYKNISEIAGLKKRLRSKEVVPKKHFPCIHASKQAIHCKHNVFDKYLKGYELIRNFGCSHPFDE